MQEAGPASSLIGAFAIASALAMGAARADAPADLPLDQVTALVHDAGFDEAWSITQYHSPKPPWMRALSVFSDREVLGDRLCRSQTADVELTEEKGRITANHPRKHSVVAFAPCMWASPRDYRNINGPSDLKTLQRLRNDLDTIDHALSGSSAGVKLTFKDEESRKLFETNIGESDIDEVYSNENGHSRFCFFTKGRDILDAPETLGVEVVPGTVTELKVDICGVIDIMPVRG